MTKCERREEATRARAHKAHARMLAAIEVHAQAMAAWNLAADELLIEQAPRTLTVGKRRAASE